jgi:cytochrome c oxidase subunit 4
MATHSDAEYRDSTDAQHSAHVVVPPSTYYVTFFWLMVLLVATLFAASLDLGEANIIIALTIAVMKAALVALYFMHLRYSTKLVRFTAVAALFWLLIMFGLTFNDYISRGWLRGF